MMAILSIMGIYRYDDSIFDDFRVPDGIDKEDVIDNILFECAELEIVYPEFDFLKLAIKRWTNKEFPIWSRLYNTTKLEYNPIWNVDAMEETTENRDFTKTGNRKITGEDTRNGERIIDGTAKDSRNINTEETGEGTENIKNNGESEDTRTSEKVKTEKGTIENVGEISGNNLRSVWGYNEDIPQDAEKVTNTENRTGTETRNLTENENINDSNKNTHEDDTTKTTNTSNKIGTSDINDNEHKETITDAESGTNKGTIEDIGEDKGTINISHRRTGNIGVTTSQKMILEERQVSEFDIIDYITKSFKRKFCLLIY